MSEQHKPASADTVDSLQRGLVYALVAIVVVLVAVMAFRQLRGGTDLLDTLSPAASRSEAGTDTGASSLLDNARRAMAESRLVSPGDDNAYAHYLAVLDVQPDNMSAREAINDLYGIAVSSAEQSIATGDFDEAARLIGLLSQANPNSFTVVNLRQRIERSQQAAAAAEQQAVAAQLAQQQQAQTAASAAATEPLAEVAEAESGDEAIADAADSDTAEVGEAAAVASAAAPEPEPERQAPGTLVTAVTESVPAVREARLLTRVNPQYPVDAMRGRQQGWVEVEFTIGPDGQVGDVSVVGSRPGRVFDRAAINAIQDWRFDPRLENGQPVASRMRQRFDFRLD